MNVYVCLYRGKQGYGCRIRGRRWMFVPAFSHSDSRVYRNLRVSDLVFANPAAKAFERDVEARIAPRAPGGRGGFLAANIGSGCGSGLLPAA